MPIEIRELEIKAAVSNEEHKQAGGQGLDKETIVQECIDQILRILKEKSES